MAMQSIEQTPGTHSTTDAILTRRDDIMRELQELRQTILFSQSQSSSSIVDQLWGALGQGAPEELTEFENDIYPEMFDDESAR